VYSATCHHSNDGLSPGETHQLAPDLTIAGAIYTFIVARFEGASIETEI
jgi:hypothetical protein